jgi:predicted dehydrogenase
MKVAVVGLGYWGPNLVRNLHVLGGCDIIACDIDEMRVKQILAQYPTAIGTTDVDAVLEDPQVSAVIVATPVTTHMSLALRALEARKSVLVEKPLATSVSDARHLIGVAKEQGVLVMAGHTFLYSPPVRLVADLVRDGAIGKPLYLQSSRVNLGIHQSQVSVLWDLAPHDLSIAIDWLGEAPCAVSANGRATLPIGQPDVVFLDVTFPSGFVANLHLSWLAPTKIRRMTLVGSKKMVVYEDTAPDEPVKVYDKGLSLPDPDDFGAYRLTYRTGDVVSPRVEPCEPLRGELEDFLGRVARQELPDEREDAACAVVATIAAAECSLVMKGMPVQV